MLVMPSNDNQLNVWLLPGFLPDIVCIISWAAKPPITAWTGVIEYDKLGNNCLNYELKLLNEWIFLICNRQLNFISSTEKGNTVGEGIKPVNSNFLIK